MTTTIDLRAAGRLRAAWAGAHRPLPGVPLWARNAAYAVITAYESGFIH